MKRAVALILTAVMLFSVLSGCKKAENNDTEQPKDEVGAEIINPDNEKNPPSDNKDKNNTVTKPTTEQNGQTETNPQKTEQSEQKDQTQKEPEKKPQAEQKPQTEQKPNKPTDTQTETETEWVPSTTITTQHYDESKLKLPIISIETNGKTPVTSRDVYLKATITVTNTQNKQYDLSATATNIKGRGNSTWLHFDKKPYKLNFEKHIDLLGMGDGTEWVLLANAFDETMLRNYIGLSLAHEMGLEFTTDFKFVNLYINGSYLGMYLLCEQQEEGEKRINIDTSKKGATDTGYLLQYIDSDKETDEKFFVIGEVDGKKLGDNNKGRFLILSPNEKICTNAQQTFIKDYVTQVNEAIFKKDWQKICSLVDINSFVNMFIVDEIMLNNDMGYSFYMYKKKGDKLYLGPIWDLDQSCGVSAWGGSTYSGWTTGSSHYWYLALMEIPEFMDLVKQRYGEKKAAIQNIVGSIDSVISENIYDIAMNNYRWGYYYGNPKKWRQIRELSGVTNYDEHVNYLKNWLNNRLGFINSSLGV